jgi:hypothetical protein
VTEYVPPVETERLILRPFDAGDAEDLYRFGVR